MARNYTPADEGQLLIDAGLPTAGKLASAIIGNFTGNNTLPQTNFYGFIGVGGASLLMPGSFCTTCSALGVPMTEADELLGIGCFRGSSWPVRW